ncbi:MAG: hypothetical protein LCH53_11905 [Bacteroidetes bacterium]|nr:hypothetical protein [Bacteroidota bacterium]
MPDAFDTLRALLERHATGLVVKTDTPDEYYLDTPHVQTNKTPLFFGSVTRKPTGVALHLMPVYTDPDLLDAVPDALRKRMTGKSCFAFKSLDAAQEDALADLLGAALERYRAHGYVPRSTLPR